MPLFRRRGGSYSLDEFVGSDQEDRAPSPLELGGKWQERLASITSAPTPPGGVALTAFTLIRGGDLFEPSKKIERKPTEAGLLDTYLEEGLRWARTRAGRTERDATLAGIRTVLRGNPAVCRRMLLAKPIRIVVVEKGADFRSYGFPPNANPRAAGLFWNAPKDDEALLGVREELVGPKPYLVVHEMTHAIHLLGMTKKERDDIDAMLVPVYRSRRWVEEVVAIYAERAFDAQYEPHELEGGDLYSKTRREWTDRAVFALFMDELLRPDIALGEG